MQDKIQKLLDLGKIDTLLITNPTNIFYITGFKGVMPTEREALLVISKNKKILITARLYQDEASKLSSDNLIVKIAAERNEYEGFIKDTFNPSKMLGFEASNLTFAEHKKYKKFTNGKFLPTQNLIEKLRVIKTDEEIAKIKRAQLITQAAFEQILRTIRVGQTEIEISDKLTVILKSLGADSLAFESIIASGPNSALPHHKTGKRKIQKGDTLLFDFGAKLDNYCADFSRTVFIGKANDIQKNTYELVEKAQAAAISKIKNSVPAKKVFEISQQVFKKEGVEEYYLHSLGHGIGLEVHESPSLSSKSKDILQNGMVFSVEPGLYYPWGGVRIEDLIVIENGKPTRIGKKSTLIELTQKT